MKAQEETASSKNAWFRFLTGIGHWQWHGFGFFILVLRQGHQQLGRMRLLHTVSGASLANVPRA
tara:strand:- start:44 stop:235 length:192 start_codon:yes stop_codon:yes gene_type:complete